MVKVRRLSRNLQSRQRAEFFGVYVLTPKNTPSWKHPIVVKFHGGLFVSLLSPPNPNTLLTLLGFEQQPLCRPVSAMVTGLLPPPLSNYCIP